MWGDAGVSLGANMQVDGASAMLWGDNDLLLYSIDVDSTGTMRVTVQVVNYDGS